MGQVGPLRWREGRGWLVLVGGGGLDETADIVRAAVEAMADESPAAVVPAASATPEEGRHNGERVIAQIESLGGPAGYVAPVFSPADATDPKNARRLMNAGLVYLGDGLARRLIETLADTPTLGALETAHQAGAVIVAEGQAAGALGVWCTSVGDVELVRGWGWLPDAIVCPSFSDAAAPALRAAIKAHPECLGLGIPTGVALALGPENQVQTLGAHGTQVTVILGPRFRPGS